MKRYYADSEWLRGRLAFRHGDDQSGTVWRDRGYYYVRALFPALRLDRHAQSERLRPGPTLGELQDLALQLQDTGASGHRQLLEAIQMLDPKIEHSFRELLRDFQTSRMSRVWLSFEATDAAQELVASLADLIRLSSDPNANYFVSQFESDVENRLEQELGDYRVSVRVLAALDSYTSPFLSSRGDGTLSLKRDLASVRWGVEFDDERDQISLPSIGDAANFSAILRLFDVAHMRENKEDSLRCLAMLLGLEEFDLANDLIDQLRHFDVTHIHRLMSHVAILGGRRGRSEDELARIVGLIQDEYRALEPDERRTLALGYGYAVFAAWARSAFGGAFGFSASKDDLGWAQWSLSVVQADLDAMTPLARLYGVNHCVYVATRANLELDDEEFLLADLERLALVTDEFRFLDTVGFALYVRARDVAEGLGARSSTENVHAMLQRAEAYLSRATELVPTDVEVRQHLELTRALVMSVQLRSDDRPAGE